MIPADDIGVRTVVRYVRVILDRRMHHRFAIDSAKGSNSDLVDPIEPRIPCPISRLFGCGVLAPVS